MGGDGISVSEGGETGWELTAIYQDNTPIFNLPDPDPLAVGKALADGNRIGLEQKPVTGCDFELAALANVKRSRPSTQSERSLGAIRTANAKRIGSGHGAALVVTEDSNRFVFGKRLGGSDKPNSLPWLKLARVFLLGVGPGERIEDVDGFLLLTDEALRFEGIADLFRHCVNLGPRGRNKQRRPPFLGGGKVGGGGLLIKLAVIGGGFGDR